MSKSEKFEVLTDVEHCRRRPQMYIGSTTPTNVEGFVLGKWKRYQIVPGLVKIIDEILDNSIDEFIRSEGKHADKIWIDIDPEGRITIEDNGRGIPVEKHDGQWRPFLSWGAARAGTSFGEERDTIGAHGLGSFLTNVFSSKFVGKSSDGKNRYEGVWKNGKLQDFEVTPDKGSTGVIVKFTPDYNFFGYMEGGPEILRELIQDRLIHLAATYPGIKFKFNGEGIRWVNRRHFSELYLKEDECVAYEDDNNILLFGPSGSDEEFRFSSHVIGLNVYEGGTPVDYLVQEFINELRPLLKKKYKLEVLPNAIKQHLMLVQVTRKMSNLKFSSQAKTKITNAYTEVKAQLPDIRFDIIARKVINNEAIVKPMVEALLFKKQLEEQRELNKEMKNARKPKIANHIAATSSRTEDKILFIAEGDSAIGRLMEVRDSKIHGGYALRGKVMNTREMRPLEIVQNTELFELMAILGLKLGEPAKNLNYGRIGILTDADVDGQSIMCLLINFFANWPELFTEGKIFRVETPLVIAHKGKDEKRLYSFEEYQKERLDDKWQVEYFKGLGTLSLEEFRKAINSPRLLKIGVKDKEDFRKLDMAFGPNADVRKEWMLK